MTLLDIRNLTIRIDGRTVVDDVSLHVDAGERVGLIGESGSGKSLTSMAVLGLRPPRGELSGSVRVEGVETIDADAATLRALRGKIVGCVFQEPQSALDPLLPIHRHLVAPLRAHGMLPRGAARETAIRLAESVGLPDAAQLVRRYPHELSGGQRQRVMIAMAMSTSPRLLLADEPTTALDVTVQARVLRLMSDLVNRSGAGSLLVTHDMAVAASQCDRIIVMQSGRIVEEGRPADLIHQPRTAYTAELIDAAYATGWQPRRMREAVAA
ncbi:ABC transporter ATP-binding protein [Microbacterium esteraromaticum]|uniref:ABC transporter ATP-binding protein n=1 Tax=Microbacterium esteraromaticum TaxID=57043 RepID=A0A939DWB5_9MICO|nr:ABC transporter ATP-binding protein [Microbacterium esteraromaticum]MBN8205218.1 ABC transporter ATP-binding protein [Microbacterium esteraromaticum]MBN8415372.1 ABC transporter ATP-binding protein [Microbacterium esteraromaticum]